MKTKLIPILVVAGVVTLCIYATRGPGSIDRHAAQGITIEADLSEPVRRVDTLLADRWRKNDLTPARSADELLVLRRLALSLMGTVPSLEEVRQFEADDAPTRIERWTVRYLNDKRYHDYFAERLARTFVGVENGAFIIFRRDRFVAWLSEQLRDNTPYDTVVTKMVTGSGLWTDDPESNFITVAQANDDLDHNKLAARSARAFLGLSLDCAQCHDHLFAAWQQEQFAGLAAQFAEVDIGGLGLHDNPKNDKFNYLHNNTGDYVDAEPGVPFNSHCLPAEGTTREKFAHWITHNDSPRFGWAIANRVWARRFGRPYIDPVDDMPVEEIDVALTYARAVASGLSHSPPAEVGMWRVAQDRAESFAAKYELIGILEEDLRTHGYDLKRLIQVIAASRAFRLESLHATEDPKMIDRLEREWAIFPLTRLRPEQVVGSMLQASRVQTIDQKSHLFIRAMRYFGEQGFVEEYGDLGDQELTERSGTIQQALIRMNSDMTRDTIKTELQTASNRVAQMCSNDEDAIETTYLICIGRRPVDEERQHFLAEMNRPGADRGAVVEDIFWALFNSPEFSWNH